MIQIASSALITFPRMFERAEFPSHHTFSWLLQVFSIVTAAYILVCHSVTNMVTPSFFRIFSNDIPMWTFCENFITIKII